MFSTVDLNAPLPTIRQCIADDLMTAARILLNNADGSRDDSAAWRIADAGYQLRCKMERAGKKDVSGLDIPTGRGVVLPDVAK